MVCCVCVVKYIDHNEALSQQRHYADIMLSAHQSGVSAVSPTQLSSMMTNSATNFEKLGDRKAVQDRLNAMTRLTDITSSTY